MTGIVIATFYSILFTFDILCRRSGFECGKADAHGIGVCVEALAVSERHNDRSQRAQTVARKLLRGDALLERKRVDATELARVPVRRQRVVCPRGVVATAVGRSAL